jgi:hypothetical protein
LLLNGQQPAVCHQGQPTQSGEQPHLGSHLLLLTCDKPRIESSADPTMRDDGHLGWEQLHPPAAASDVCQHSTATATAAAANRERVVLHCDVDCFYCQVPS